MDEPHGTPRGSGQAVHDKLTRLLSVAMIAIGAALVVRGAGAGAAFGVIIGVLFLIAGTGRLYVQSRRRSGP